MWEIKSITFPPHFNYKIVRMSQLSFPKSLRWQNDEKGIVFLLLIPQIVRKGPTIFLFIFQITNVWDNEFTPSPHVVNYISVEYDKLYFMCHSNYKILRKNPYYFSYSIKFKMCEKGIIVPYTLQLNGQSVRKDWCFFSSFLILVMCEKGKYLLLILSLITKVWGESSALSTASKKYLSMRKGYCSLFSSSQLLKCEDELILFLLLT